MNGVIKFGFVLEVCLDRDNSGSRVTGRVNCLLATELYSCSCFLLSSFETVVSVAVMCLTEMFTSFWNSN